jgi:polyisoprenoid-binding protein YceI
VVVPDQSKASYLANEEFFAGALKKLGITAGKRTVVGSTQAIEGQFQLDPKQPAAGLGDNTFTVRMDTLTTDQPRRDQYIREDGPRFADYPLATFKATAIEPAASVGGSELRVSLAGDMTIRQVTRRATFDVKAQLTGNTLAGIATTRLLMSSFGIEPLDFYNTMTVADEVGLEVRFVARAR